MRLQKLPQAPLPGSELSSCSGLGQSAWVLFHLPLAGQRRPSWAWFALGCADCNGPALWHTDLRSIMEAFWYQWSEGFN